MGSVDIRKLDINDDSERWSFCSKILIKFIHMQLLCNLKSVMPNVMGTKISRNGALRGKQIVTIERIEHPVDSLHPEFQSHSCEE
eukprot:scaffold253292_cov46-Attheya_sp.AAC.1